MISGSDQWHRRHSPPSAKRSGGHRRSTRGIDRWHRRHSPPTARCSGGRADYANTIHTSDFNTLNDAGAARQWVMLADSGESRGGWAMVGTLARRVQCGSTPQERASGTAAHTPGGRHPSNTRGGCNGSCRQCKAFDVVAAHSGPNGGGSSGQIVGGSLAKSAASGGRRKARASNGSKTTT